MSDYTAKEVAEMRKALDEDTVIAKMRKALDRESSVDGHEDPRPRADEVGMLDRLAEILQKRLGIEFHGWGEDENFTCHNFYLNGHCRSKRWGKAWIVRGNLEHLWIFSGFMNPYHLALVKAFVADPSQPMRDWVPITYSKFSSDRCTECGQPILLETDGHVIRVQGKCDYPNGYPKWTVEVDVPSGKLVFNDDLREWFREAETATEDVERKTHVSFSQSVGMHRCAELYSQDGLMTGFCGNTCPSVFRETDSPDTLWIGNAAYDEKTDEEQPVPGTERVAGISTALWWFSAADLSLLESVTPVADVYAKTGIVQEEQPDLKIPGEIVEVTPGRYRMTYLYHYADRDNYSVPQMFAKIERVGEVPEPSERRHFRTMRIEKIEQKT